MSERDQFGRARRTSRVTVTVRGVVGALIIAVLVVFAVQNFDSVEVRFLTVSFGVPLWILVIGAAVLGALLGGSVRSLWGYLRGAGSKD